MATDIYIPNSNEKSRYITLSKSGELLLKEKEETRLSLGDGYTDDFDALSEPNGQIHVFAVNNRGALCHICPDKENIKTNILLESRGDGKKICKIRVLKINAKLHLFYCLMGTDRFIVHQILEAGDYSMQPYVVDHIGRKCVYDVTRDDEDNIHMMYTSDEGRIRHVKYVYNRKVHTAPSDVAEFDAREIVCVASHGILYSAFVAFGKGRTNIYVCNASTGMCVTVTVNVHPKTELSLLPANDGVRIHWRENSMCFGVDCSQRLVISRVNILGKCRAMIRNGACGTDSEFCVLAVSASGSPFTDIVNEKEKEPAPRGYEVEELAQRYKKVLLQQYEPQNDFKNDLMMIEASLERLIMLVETALEKGVNKSESEYNVEDASKEEIVDE